MKINPFLAPAKPAKPVEEWIPCTNLPAEIARIEAEGGHVMRMDRERQRGNGSTFYLLTVAPKGSWRWLK